MNVADIGVRNNWIEDIARDRARSELGILIYFIKKLGGSLEATISKYRIIVRKEFDEIERRKWN